MVLGPRQGMSVGVPHQHNGTDRAHEDPEIVQQALGPYIFEVTVQPVKQLVRRISLAAPAAHLRQPGQAGLHAVACRVVGGDALERNACSAGAGCMGLGPTTDISPRRMLNSCGSSSIELRLRKWPIQVTRA